MMETREEIAALIKRIAQECGYERAAIAAVDLLLQWRESDKLYMQTRNAWERYLREKKDGCGHIDTERHGAWVPAIPL